MESGESKKWFFLLAGLVIGAVVGYVIAFSLPKKELVDIIRTAPNLTEDQKSGNAVLSDAEKKAVLFHKDAIIRRLASKIPLTDTERNIVFTIALTDTGLYNFNTKEREMLSEVLKLK